MTKKIIIGLLIGIVFIEGGYYVYKNQARSDRRTVAVRIESPAGGVREGAMLAIAGVNATGKFSIRFMLTEKNPVATIREAEDAVVIHLDGADALIIPRGAASAVIAGKIKSVYGHDPLPLAAEAFDAVKLIAAGTARIPVGKPIDAETLRLVFKGLRGYIGESGAVQFDGQGVGHR